MGLFDFVKKQFIDIIQWTEPEDGILLYRYPMADMEIQNGAALIVRDSQAALFVNEGTVADQFGPGTYKLTTQTLPVLTYLKNWDKLFESPFKSDVLFFSTRLQLDRRWGTPNPVVVRDKDFGVVRLRAFGNYTYKLSDPKKFYAEIGGTRETYTADELEGQLSGLVVQAISDSFAKSGVAFFDMAGNFGAIAQQVQPTLTGLFERYGITLDSFTVQNVSLPEEIQAALDKRINMNILGDLNRYTQFQTAESIPLAAQNPGGIAGIGAGLAAGMAMGQSMMQNLGVPTPQQPGAAAPSPSPSGGDDIAGTLETLHNLMTKGVLTQQEFEAKKAELLKKL